MGSRFLNLGSLTESRLLGGSIFFLKAFLCVFAVIFAFSFPILWLFEDQPASTTFWTATALSVAMACVHILMGLAVIYWPKFREYLACRRVRTAMMRDSEISDEEFARAFPDLDQSYTLALRHSLAVHLKVEPNRIRPEHGLAGISSTWAVIGFAILSHARLLRQTDTFFQRLLEWKPRTKPTVGNCIHSLSAFMNSFNAGDEGSET